MQQWEYKVEELYYVYDSEWKLNNIGDDGWELVGIYKELSSTYAVFKRPKER